MSTEIGISFLIGTVRKDDLNAARFCSRNNCQVPGLPKERAGKSNGTEEND
jgi:hypothetical protein